MGLVNSFRSNKRLRRTFASMAALLYLRRRAAAAALAGVAPRPQWLATAARRGALGSGDDGGETGERGKSPWLQLPPFAPLDAAAAARAISRGGGEGGDGEQGATAIKWVRRCCPDLPTSLVQKLFRLRKVRTTRSNKCPATFLSVFFYHMLFAILLISNKFQHLSKSKDETNRCCASTVAG